MLLGNGDGSFQWAFDYTLALGSTSIAVGEFNGDGIQDLVIDASSGVRVLLGNGNGTFQPPLNFPTATPGKGTSPWGISMATGIRTLQLPAHRQAVFRCCWEMERAHSRRHYRLILGFLSGRHAKRSLAVGDFNGDGSQDLVATNVAGSVSVLLGNGNGTFRAPLIFDTGRPGAIFSWRGRFQ